MRIYISGICGTGMGPLALMANQAGIEVFGSDKAEGAISPELDRAGIKYEVGSQDGSFLNSLDNIDWFIYTSALPEDHPELRTAKKLGLRTTKRDEFINFLVEKLGLKMIAVAGTHGKTTTTAMIIWVCSTLDLPASWLVGTTLGFAPSGSYRENDQYFIYEADEYDRNFLNFHPYISLIPFVSYDHPDIYPTPDDYLSAFEQFESQSETVIKDVETDPRFTLVGDLRKKDATLALFALKQMFPRIDENRLVGTLNAFPGVGRRFERLTAGVYTDYAHHPEEIAATLEMAREETDLRGLKGVVALYEPHQNTRQHEVRGGYKDAFTRADQLFWLPTYLTRENPDLPVITPEEFIADLSSPKNAETAEAGDALGERLCYLRDEGYLILLMTAGPADEWLRTEVKNWE